MKWISMVFTFLCLSLNLISQAHENKQIFIGKTGPIGQEKVAFILNVVDSDIEKYLHISEETGEMYLKVNNLVAMTRDAFDQIGLNANRQGALSQSELISLIEADRAEVRCPNCKRYYDPEENRWTCPWCGTRY